MIWPVRIAVPDTVVTGVRPRADINPKGAQPTHPGPVYHETKAGDQKPKLPGIQNHPKSGEKFQKP
jgi:hypothetical protein